MTQVARLKITLTHVEPAVLRQIEVPLAIKLNHLHDVIQVAMGWNNSHLYMFRAGQSAWTEPDPYSGSEGFLPADRTSLKQVLESTGSKTLHYIYDFGDDWHHVIKVEKLIDAAPDTLYPRLLKATGACPPEDIGGPPGYAYFLEIIANPEHEEHEEQLEWYGELEEPDIEYITDVFGRMAELWASKPQRKPAAKKPGASRS